MANQGDPVYRMEKPAPDPSLAMSLPDFTAYGYHITRILGSSPEGGRATYLAQRQQDQGLVVLKVFYFGLTSSSWSGYKAYEREIQVLQRLDHPRIPKYLASFEIESGFCLVQEYKNAPSLATRRPYSLDQIKQIAISVLEVLVYLQSHRPPIFHRDLKPENILVDQQLNAYLIDFGLARVNSSSVALTSMAAGTLGFMPPEELFNRSLTRASDLYSLGATLLCLITHTPSTQIGSLVDQSFQLKVEGRLPKASRALSQWLQRMIAPNPEDRFGSANLALQALRNTPVRSVSVPFPTMALAKGLGWITVGALPLLLLINISRMPLPSRRAHQSLLAPRVNTLLTQGVCSENPFEICDLRRVRLEREHLQGVDLQKAMLSNAVFNGSQLQGANLIQAELDGAYLIRTDLSNADLTQAFLDRAVLKNANLAHATLARARAQLSDLSHANLHQATLPAINLTGAVFYQSTLTKANLELASLHHSVGVEADLSQANLRNANLPHANLQRANLTQADLRNTSFLNSDLRGAILVHAQLNAADLQGANLRGADLRGADLRGANLQEADLQGAQMAGTLLKGAIMPDGSTHP